MLASLLAAGLALAGCKSDDQPKQPPKTNLESAQEKVADTARAAKEKADTAADKAKHALGVVKDQAMAAGELAVDAITDPKTLRGMLAVVDDRISKAADAVQQASTEDARRAATAALEKLKQEKLKLEERLAALKDAKAP